MPKAGLLALILMAGILLCLTFVRPGQTQVGGLRRVTNTSEEGLNLNPSISGDGRVVSFESTEDVAGAGGTDHFRALRANVAVDPATFFQLAVSRAVTPAMSQDGARIAFASKDDPLGTNNDGNSEIFLFDGAKLIQITNTTPGNLADRVVNGNFQPSMSDDGRFVAFSSNRNPAGQNPDGNLEIFLYDLSTSAFTQLTNTNGVVGNSDAKISGDGSTLAYIRDPGATPSAARDLLKQPRVGPAGVTVLATGVPSLAMSYGRAISDDGLRVVYSSLTATNTTQVFLADGRNGNTLRQITSLGARVTEVPLHPTISGDGSRIAFAARRSVAGAPSNSDGGVELYVYDLPTSTFSKITNAPSSATADVVSSLSDDGTVVAFNFPRILSGAVVNSDSANNSEIYITAPPARPPNGTLTAVLNGASFGHEPSAVKAVAPNSIAVAQGSNLANQTLQTQRLPDGTFPTNAGGTRVTVNGRAAQIFFVSPTQVNFLVPPQTEIGSAEVVVTNSENFGFRGTVPTLNAAPGIFTRSGDGIGEGVILNTDTQQAGPFDPTAGNLRLDIFATGARNATQNVVSIAGRLIAAEPNVASPDLPGLDEVRFLVPADLRGAGPVNISVISDGRESNPVTVTFSGDPARSIFINEVLADPPDGIAGDANHDGVRDGTQDEFVELVNGTTAETISVSGWTIKTRPTGSATETTRFTLPAGASIAPGQALVVFGGGGAAFNPNDGVFGCAQVFRITNASGLSLTNGGLTILIRDASGNLITQLAYGGATGLEGDNNQSLTRSPDITGAYLQHAQALNANGRAFSPGLRTDGTPFGNCAGRLTSVSISPVSANAVVGQITEFTALALDQYGRVVPGIFPDFVSDNTNAAIIESVLITPSTGVTIAKVRARNPGIAHITASANDGTTTVTSPQATLTVTGPSLSINDVTRNEGDTGTTTFTFTVSLSTAAPSPVTFDIATQDSTATVANSDYVARTLTSQIIPAGQQSYTFDVTVNGDLNIEPNENFLVNVTNVIGASLADGQGLGTILSDDAPALSVNDVSDNEGDTGTKTFTFTLSSTLPAPPGGITFDIATANNTATVAGGDYVTRTLTNQSIPAGQTTYTFEVTVNGDTLVEANESFFVNVTNVSSNAIVSDGQGIGTIQNDDIPVLVVSQLYGGGGNAGATFQNDFIEIYNRGTTTVNVAGWSVQYAAATGSSWSVTPLCPAGPCLVQPGRYYLVQEDQGSGGTINLPTPDAIGTISMTTGSGKVALVTTTAALSGTCPSNSAILDLVGYGGTATCFEGSGPAAAPGNTTADFRKAGGCLDTNDNANDFFVASPNPRNSSSPVGACQPEITINDATVTEGNSGTVSAVFTVSLSAASSQVVTVNFATADDTAVAPADYQANSSTLTFNPGELSRQITVLVNGDTLDEPNEKYFVNLSNAANAVLLDSQGEGTINDNDPTPSISINDVAIAEGDSGTTALNFTVSLSAASGQTVTVNYATADNTATSVEDYQSASAIVTFNPGEISKQIQVVVIGDTTFEPNETLFVNLTSPVNASLADSQGQGAITNDDAPPPTPTLFLGDASAVEGDAGTSIITFHVALIPASGSQVKVDYATANGTAIAGTDYQATNGTLTFDPGDTGKSITVTIDGDRLVEFAETFSVTLSNPTGGALIGNPTATGTIENDDVADLVISQVYGGGNNAGAPFQNDFVEIFNRGNTTVDFGITPYSVQYASVGSNFGGATASARTILSSGSILPGKYFLVQESGGATNGAVLPAADAIGSINLAATSGKVALVAGTAALAAAACPGDDGAQPFNPSQASVADFVGYGSAAGNVGQCYEGPVPAPAPSNTTADFRKAGGCTDTNSNTSDLFALSPFPRNSAAPSNNCAGFTPTLSINDVTITEGNSGTKSATFTVSLLDPPEGTDVIFDIATANGTATTANNDYVAQSLTNQIIPAGQTTYSFTVTINGDTAVEADETFLVNVTNVSGAFVADAEGLGTIQSDDQPALSIDDVSLTEGNTGTKLFSFHVTLDTASPAPVTFDIATQDSSATEANSDYVAHSLTSQTIPAGSTSYTFDVTVNGDTNTETNEIFLVNVSNVTGATVADGQGSGSILNDDSPTFAINDVFIAEGNTGTSLATFTVTLSPANNQPTTVDYATANDTATAGSDYQLTGNTLTFNTGETSKQISVTINGDKLVEPSETFFINLSNPGGGATIGDAQGLGTIQNDDVADLKISQIYPGGGLSGASFTNDFIEVFNQGDTTVDFSITPYSIQFLSTAGATWAKTDLTSGSIEPGRYYLIREASGGATGAGLPVADATGSINLTSTTPGKIALVAGGTLLTGSCPTGSAITDFAGYSGTSGTANHCFEGSGPAPFPSGSNTTADFRKAGGCTDVNDNFVDFFTSTPFPRNSASPANNCAGFTPNLSINDVTVSEGNSGTTTATFTVSLSAPAQGADVRFDIATQNNTALSGSDYVANSLTNQIIPAGQTSYTFTVVVNGDAAVEPDEGFFVNVTNVAGAVVTDSQGIGTIQHDDLPALSIDDVSATEGDSGTKTFAFHVTLSAPAPATVTFDIGTANNSATTADNDYVANSLTNQTIAQGATSFTFNVTVNGDQNIELNETFFANVSNVSGATVLDGQGLGTIQNDDSPVLNINDVLVAEGNAGVKLLTFTISSTLPAPAGGITFDIATADWTAQDDNPAVSEDNDYVANAITGKTITAGSSSTTFDVTINGDTLVEPNETFFVHLTNATNATIGDSQGEGAILNDDVPLLVISQLYGGGGNSGSTYKNDFIEIYNRGSSTVNLNGYSVQYSGDTSGTWSKTDLTSVLLAPGKYYLIQEAQGAGGTTNLPTPDATGSIAMATSAGKVALVSNTTVLSGTCPSSSAILDFVGYGATASCSETSPAPAPSNTNADVRKGGGCVDTNNNSADFFTHAASPRNTATPANVCGGQSADLYISDVTVTEGNSGTVNANFTVFLVSSSLSTVTVDYSTANGTATDPADYVAAPTTQLIFNPGETSKPVTIQVKGDTLDEPDETFFVNLSNPTNAGILDSQGLGTITDDDVPPTLTINDVSQNEGNSGATTFAFTVHLSAPALTGGVTFDIATADGTAEDDTPGTEDNDFVAQALTGITIPAGSQDYVFNVTVNGDTNIEGNETFLVNVTNVSGATVGDAQGQGTIQNDDSPTLSINDVTQNEGNSGTTIFSFTVTSSLPAPAGGITFDIATADGTAQDDNPATEDNDYVAQTLVSQLIPAGQTTYTFDVSVNGDTKNEAVCETFFVNISNPTNATITDSQGQGGITDEDGTKLVISQVYGAGGNVGATYTNDFIEIFNRGYTAVSLNGMSVQYSAATSTSGSFSVTTLPNVMLQPGQYFLIQEAGGANGVALPTPDVTGTIVMAATAGKVALVNSTTALSAAGCPSGATVLDFVGYGTTANCREGSSTADNAGAPSASTSDQRKLGGCQDTGNNNNDFSVATPSARNSATATNTCGCSTSYSSLFIFGGNTWKESLASLSPGWYMARPRIPFKN